MYLFKFNRLLKYCVIRVRINTINHIQNKLCDCVDANNFDLKELEPVNKEFIRGKVEGLRMAIACLEAERNKSF